MNKQVKRWIVYLIGLIVLALGLILNTKSTLGVSPIISSAFAVSEIYGLSFPNMTLILYCILVGIEMIIHIIMKKDKSYLIKDILQVPLSIVFTRFMNIFTIYIPVFETAYPDSFIGSIPGRICVLALAIVCTGIGAALSLDVRLIPNPGDGVVQAIADVIKKPVGLTKNFFDIFNVCLSCSIGLFLAGKIIGVGIGTVIAMFGVGRVIAITNYFVKKKIDVLVEQA